MPYLHRFYIKDFDRNKYPLNIWCVSTINCDESFLKIKSVKNLFWSGWKENRFTKRKNSIAESAVSLIGRVVFYSLDNWMQHQPLLLFEWGCHNFGGVVWMGHCWFYTIGFDYTTLVHTFWSRLLPHMHHMLS